VINVEQHEQAKGVKTYRMGPYKEGLDATGSSTMAVSVWVKEVGVEAATGNRAHVCVHATTERVVKAAGGGDREKKKKKRGGGLIGGGGPRPKWGGPCEQVCRQGWASGWWAKHTEQGGNFGLIYSPPCKKHDLIVMCAYAADAGAFFQCAG